jgi:hypothetical protein
MKKVLFPLFIFCFTFGLSAQVFEFYDVNFQLVPNGDTVFFNGPESSSPTINMKVKNISASQQIVHCRKSYVYIVPGTDNAFCWAGNCYTTMVASNSATMNPGDTNSTFSAEYMPQGIAGTSIIKYKFYNDSGDTAMFIIKYKIYTTGIESNANEQIISHPFPVPAENFINYIVSDNISDLVIELHDITGKMVKTIKVNNTGLLQISVSDLNSGIYFAEVKSGNRVIRTNRIIVR